MTETIRLDYDPQLRYLRDCEVLADLTPNRKLTEKVYLCKCNVCNQTFTRCRKTLVYHHSDCGCVKNNATRSGMYTDNIILNADMLTKRVFVAKLNVLCKPVVAEVFTSLYIDNNSYSEYTAMSMGLSMAVMYRIRRKIHKLWSEYQQK